MKTSYAALAVALASPSLSAPTQTPRVPTPKCTELMIPVKASANNTVFPPFPDCTDSGVFYNYLRTFNASALPVAPVSGSFNISALYCEPSVKVKGREGTVQLLLHGLTSTKEYWTGFGFPNATFEGQYSWVAHAASQGYATLAIDNLGNGMSSHPDPLQVVQPTMQLTVIYTIMARLRAGALVPEITTKYGKVIMATHSYGSVLGRVLSTVFPTSGADAYVLTAAAGNMTGLQAFLVDIGARAASVVDRGKFGGRFDALPAGYLSATKAIRDVIYGLDGTFDPAMAEWDANATPHVFAAGEVSGASVTRPSAFKGPVMYISGRQDQIACGTGSIFDVPAVDCGVGAGSHIEEARSLFPNATAFEAYVPEGTGHNVNTHYSAGQSFGAAMAWLQSVGF